jgi:hypothetical protein
LGEYSPQGVAEAIRKKSICLRSAGRNVGRTSLAKKRRNSSIHDDTGSAMVPFYLRDLIAVGFVGFEVRKGRTEASGLSGSLG